jgi:CTP:molybdopterin cytidylyltransferase MocA
MSQENPTRKIIVDEDWKEEAQREKERLAEEIEQARREKLQPPLPASFSVLVASLATQAAIHLGDMPHPLTGKTEVNLAEARFHIDMLGVLQEKTRGNLTPEEAKALDTVLFDLRMRFVEKSK